MSILDADFVEKHDNMLKLANFFRPKYLHCLEDEGRPGANRYLRRQCNDIARYLGFKSMTGFWSTLLKQEIPVDKIGAVKDLLNKGYVAVNEDQEAVDIIMDAIQNISKRKPLISNLTYGDSLILRSNDIWHGYVHTRVLILEYYPNDITIAKLWVDSANIHISIMHGFFLKDKDTPQWNVLDRISLLMT